MKNWLYTTLLGIGGSIVMDTGSAIWNRLFGGSSLDYALVGRWIGHFPHGQIARDSIRTSHPVRHERQLGLTAHFGIGIGIAHAMLSLTGASWKTHPTLMPAMIAGVGTVTAPWFLMQPAFGLGIAANKTPNPRAARRSSLRAHAFYGLGLWISGLVLRRLSR